MKKNQYIEISNRGTGKTFRLAEAIIKFRRQNPQCKIVVFTPSLIQAKYIKEHVEKQQVYTNISYLSFEAESNRGIKFDMEFYDEFPFSALDKLIVKDNIYACTSTPGE